MARIWCRKIRQSSFSFPSPRLPFMGSSKAKSAQKYAKSIKERIYAAKFQFHIPTPYRCDLDCSSALGAVVQPVFGVDPNEIGNIDHDHDNGFERHDDDIPNSCHGDRCIDFAQYFCHVANRRTKYTTFHRSRTQYRSIGDRLARFGTRRLRYTTLWRCVFGGDSSVPYR